MNYNLYRLFPLQIFMNSTTTAKQLDTKTDSDRRSYCSICESNLCCCCLTWSQSLPDVVSEREDSEGSASDLGDADILQNKLWRATVYIMEVMRSIDNPVSPEAPLEC